MNFSDHLKAVMAASAEDALSFGEEVLRVEYTATARALIKSRKLRDAWLRALVVARNETGVAVYLPDRQQGEPQTALAWLAEEGLPRGFDLKPFLLKGRTFVDVPFDKTVGMVEHYVAAVQDGAGQAKAKQALAALKPWTYASGAGGRATLVGRGDYQPAGGLVPKIRPYHVADPLHRVMRQEATYSQKEGDPVVTQTTGYRFFRRVSVNSAPESWTYRQGLPGAHVFVEHSKKGKDKVVGEEMVRRRRGPVLAFLKTAIEQLQVQLAGA